MQTSRGQSLEDVFKKWEKRGEERRLNAPKSYDASYKTTGKNDSLAARSAWQQRFDSSTLPRRRTNRKKYRVTGQNGANEHFYTMLSEKIERKFQLIPPVVESFHRSTRPFLSTGCSKCFQNSKMMYTTDKVKNSPLRNLLDLSVFCRKSLFRSAFHDILYVANLPLVNSDTKTSEMKNAIMKSPGVGSTIERLTNSEERLTKTQDIKGEVIVKTTSKELKMEARNIFNAMSGSIKGYCIKIATWILFKFFGKIFSSIHVHQGQITMLHEASKQNIPLVYLPLHKSHLDYVLISFVLSWYGLKVPFVAAGDNLRGIPFFSRLMRNMGGFFIQRKFGQVTPRNELYRAVLNEYISQILISGNNLEIFIEGTRSRSGKSYPPKTGVLASVVSAVTQDRVSDVLVVPVNISYEKILEAGYADELLGKAKRPESFWQTMKNVWRIFRSHFGQVRVEFGLPFSLKEIIRTSESSESWQNFMKTISNPLSSPDSPSITRNVSETTLESLDRSTVALTKGIANHVLYECVKNSTIMGVNMVAFLLLTRFREGVELRDLSHSFELLKKDILMHKRDYGFSGANEDVILHSIQLLGKDLVSWNRDLCIIKPILSLPNLLHLSYYSNQVISVFVLESVVACSIGALLANENTSLSELIYQNTSISRTELLNTALDLCDLLRKEFIFTPPCVPLETVLIDAIENFIAADVLTVHEKNSLKSRDRQWANRLAISTTWSDDDESEEQREIVDQEYKINSSEEAAKKLKYFRDILAPIMESYWFVACSLLALQESQYNEKDFMTMVHSAAIARVQSGTALFNESCYLVTIKNAIAVFKECQVLHVIENANSGVEELRLTTHCHKKDVIDLVAYINRYKT